MPQLNEKNVLVMRIFGFENSINGLHTYCVETHAHTYVCSNNGTQITVITIAISVYDQLLDEHPHQNQKLPVHPEWNVHLYLCITTNYYSFICPFTMIFMLSLCFDYHLYIQFVFYQCSHNIFKQCNTFPNSISVYLWNINGKEIHTYASEKRYGIVVILWTWTYVTYHNVIHIICFTMSHLYMRKYWCPSFLQYQLHKIRTYNQ